MRAGYYAVQPGRGKKAIGRIIVTGVLRDRLGGISAADVRAEGYASWQAFINHGRRSTAFDRDAEVWSLSFS
jgi:hypothetical protein